MAMDTFFAGGGSPMELTSKAIPFAAFSAKFGFNAREDSEPFDHIEYLRERVLITQNPYGRIYAVESDEYITKEQLEIATKSIPPVRTSKAGKPGYVTAAADYLMSPQRHEVGSVVFDPTQPPLSETADGCFNCYRGLDVKPVEGDASAFEDLLKHLTQEEPEHLPWLREWSAYPLQHPGEKLHQAVVLEGEQHGGKSLFGVALGELYGGDRPGSYFRAINQQMLHGSFNPFAYKAFLVLGNEIAPSDKRSAADNLKDMIDRKTVELNRKFQPQIVIRDHANYIFTSNHGNAIFLEDPDGDRRYFVLHVPCRIPKDLADRVWDLSHTPEGRSALLYYLLQVDVSDFNPHGRAPRTRAQGDMYEDSSSDLDCFVQGIVDRARRGFLSEITTAARVAAQWNRTHNREVAVKAAASSLRKAKARSLQKVNIGDGESERPWALCNCDTWRRSDPDAVRKALDEDDLRPAAPKREKY